jgi:hypothetical protein
MAAVTAAAIGAATAIGGAYMAKKQGDKQAKLAQKGIDAADPFRTYRPEYAKQLDALMKDPSSIKNTPEYKARLDAAARQLAAQGYTGSGNAILEAANAGGAAYQQAFQNLSQLSGASTTPGGGYAEAQSSLANSDAQKLSAYSGVANNLGNLALTYGQRFNQAATPAGNTMAGSLQAATGGSY